MGRYVGVDYGKRRIGLAITDPDGMIASPAAVLQAAGAPGPDADRVAKWIQENEGAVIVVGMPYNMDDSIGPQARVTQEFVTALRARTACEVHTCDERLSSFQADQWLRQRESKRSAARRGRDALAALAILQAFLAARPQDPNSATKPDARKPDSL